MTWLVTTNWGKWMVAHGTTETIEEAEKFAQFRFTYATENFSKRKHGKPPVVRLWKLEKEIGK